MKRSMVVKMVTQLILFVIVWVVLTHVNQLRGYTKCTLQDVLQNPHVSVLKERNISFTEKRWFLKQPYEEMLFLYKEMLIRNHTFNITNMKSFKKYIKADLGNNISQLLFVTQQNSPVGTTLQHYLKKSKTKTYHVSDDFYRLLPKGPTVSRSRRCSVVGNSGNLLHSKCGKQIDSADLIYRCNAAPLKSFAQDAGLQSTITSLNPSILNKRYNGLEKQADVDNFMEDMREYNGYLWGACLSSSSYIDVCMKALDKYNNTENKFVMGHPDHYQKITKFWNKLGFSMRPSTGFYFVSEALIRCNEINLYGFWPFPHIVDSTTHSVSYHYFDDVMFPGTDGWVADHSMNEEFSLLVQLHLLGVLKLNIGQC